MARWMKALAVALAAVVGLVPAFAQVGYAQALLSPSVVLPVGDELEEEDLLEAEGEFWKLLEWVVALGAAALYGIGYTIYDAFFDGEPGIQHTKQIIGGTMGVYCGAFLLTSWLGTIKILIQ